jgi:hypothetical protein
VSFIEDSDRHNDSRKRQADSAPAAAILAAKIFTARRRMAVKAATKNGI